LDKNGLLRFEWDIKKEDESEPEKEHVKWFMISSLLLIRVLLD
jgi:hypothetical protein